METQEQENTQLSLKISTLPLPKATDLQEWNKPANLGQLKKWMQALTPFYNTGLATAGLAEAAVKTAEALVAGGFTGAEIRFAFRRMWTDKTIYWAFAKNYPLNPGAFIPHINDLRRLQAALMVPCSANVVQRLCAEFPGEIHPGDFAVSGFSRDGRDNQMLTYKHAGRLRDMGAKHDRLQVAPEAQQIGELLTAYGQ